MSCDWPIDRTCLPDLPVLGDSPTDEQQAAYDAALASRNSAEDLAVQVLWALSGRQFGICPVIVRPCPEVAIYPSPWNRMLLETPPGSGLYILAWNGFMWMNVGCGCAGRCHLSGPRMVHLPGPVSAIEEIVVGNVVLDDSEYSVEGDLLYRIGHIWPSQHLGRPMGEVGTWSVKYLRGYAPPAGTAKYVGTMAAEFLKACAGDNTCRLPRTVTVASRQGVSYRVYDPAAIYGNGKTGIPEVDLWLAAINPNHLAVAPSVI